MIYHALAMSTAAFDLLAAHSAHADCFIATPPDKETLEKAFQWYCSLPKREFVVEPQS